MKSDSTLKRLSPDDLRIVVTVEPQLRAVAENVVQSGQTRTYESIEKAADALEAIPEIKKFFEAHRLTAAEFLRILDSTIRALANAPAMNRADIEVMRANVQLVNNPPEDVAAALREWSRTRLGL